MDKNKKYIEAKLVKSNDQIEFIATDETLDRQGEVIAIDSWDLNNYRKNPVLLVNHDYQVQNIVGRADNIRYEQVNGKMSLVFTPNFHEITQLSKEVKQMVEEGILSTVSVGFLRRGPEKDGDREKNELMEVSFVPVPANPSAERLRSIMTDALPEAELLAVKAFAAVEVKEGRVISEKNKKLIGIAVDSMKQSIAALEGLLNLGETEIGQEGVIASEQKDQTFKNLGERKAQPLKVGREKRSKLELRTLQRLAGEIQNAIYQAKKQ